MASLTFLSATPAVPASPFLITPDIKNPQNKNPRHTRRHLRHDESRQDPPWQDWCQVSDYKESLIGSVGTAFAILTMFYTYNLLWLAEKVHEVED